MSFFKKLKQGLAKSSSKISEGINDIFVKKKLDDETLEELEDLLITSDLGPEASSEIITNFSKNKFGKEIDEKEIKESLAEEINKILEPKTKKLSMGLSDKPQVLIFVGVNGTGKTTSIGKLSKQFKDEGKKVMIAACDTFRAAAIEQLQKWADRSEVDFFSSGENADPASVAYQAYEKALRDNTDILIIDTAGRLHNKKQLMDELAKIIRVLKKHDENFPNETILVLDATTGQNAVAQAEVFNDVTNLSGIIVTKLDGSAKGGVIVALAKKFDLPFYAVGVGEGIEDLKDFNSREFADALVGL